MKKAIIIIGLCVAVTGHTSAQTNQIVTNVPVKPPVAASNPAPFVMPDEIITRTGDVYKYFRIERHDASGLTISYSMPGGGLGITKLSFDNLSDALQKKYGYDPQQAALYREEEKQAAADWGAKMEADEKYGAIIRAQREKEEADAAAVEAAAKAAAIEKEKQDELNEREVEAQEKAAEAAMVQADNPPQTTIIQQQQQQ
jgi:hypothetical protein